MYQVPSSLWPWSQPTQSRLIRESLPPSSESSPRIHNIGVSCWYSLSASPFWARSSLLSSLRATLRRPYSVRARLRRPSRLLNSATRRMWTPRRSWTSCKKIPRNRLALSLWGRRYWILGTPEWHGSSFHSLSLTCFFSGWLSYCRMSPEISSPCRRKRGHSHWNLSTFFSLTWPWAHSWTFLLSI